MADVVSTNEFKTGMHIELEGSVWRIVDFQHVKPGKGGAFVRTKVKSINSGSVVDKTFRAGEKFPRVYTEVKNMQYLYDSGDEVVFMDEQTYEQLSLPHASLEAELPYMQPSTPVQLLFVGGQPSGVQLPSSIELAVTDTEPGVKGDTVSNVTKPATLETGAVVAGAALRERGRPDQGRPPRRPLHLPRLMAVRRLRGRRTRRDGAARGLLRRLPVGRFAERHLELPGRARRARAAEARTAA